MHFNHLTCHGCTAIKRSLFHKCRNEELDYLDAHKKSIMYKKGQVVFHEGDDPEKVFCVHDGKVKIVKSAANDREHITRLAAPGDLMGYRSLLGNHSYEASAVTLEDSIICSFPKSVFFELLRMNTTIYKDMMNKLTTELEEANEKIKKLAHKNVKERVAEALLVIANKFYPENDPPITFAFSRQDLANIVGASKETTIRCLTELREENIVSSDKENITILDKDRLLQASNIFD